LRCEQRFVEKGIGIYLGFGIWDLGFPEGLLMKVRALAFVAIPVTDIGRARSFYEGLLGLTVSDQMMGGQWIEYDLGNNTLAIANVGEHWRPSDQGTGAALEVDDFEQSIKQLKQNDVPFVAEPFESPCCRMAVVQDPDGNNLIIHKLKSAEEKEPCP
jgi:predicted enzyme related to lactoylglutathione lyase